MYAFSKDSMQIIQVMKRILHWQVSNKKSQLKNKEYLATHMSIFSSTLVE
jgi:hypothetical protein